MKKIMISSLDGENIYEDYLAYILDNLEEYRINLEKLDGDEIKKLFFQLRENMRDALIEYLIERNQYVYIDEKFKLQLDRILNKYILELLKNIINSKADKLIGIFNNLNFDLLNFLNQYDEIKKIRNMSEDIPNFEYGGEIQLSLLGINALLEPVLDIGCGKNHNLVSYLREKGIEAYGLDRYNFKEKYLFNKSWIEYDYGFEKYGSIIAHMSYSNHFIRANLKMDDLYMDYGTSYMKILASLKVGGSFYYTPSLEFIENLLDKKSFEVNYKELENAYKAVKITKLSKEAIE